MQQAFTLSERFIALLGARLGLRFFRRRDMLETLDAPSAGHEAPPGLLDAARETGQDLLARLGTTRQGLLDDEAASVRARVGANEVEHEKPLPWWRHLFHCYRNPFNLLLSALAAVSYATDDTEGTIIISAMVIISTVLRFVQEARSNKAAEKLKAMVSTTATVLRREARGDGTTAPDNGRHPGRMGREIPLAELVPGDIVLLAAGDMIPADVRIVAAKDLFVSQSALTGEALPVEKFAHACEVDAGGSNPLTYDNLAFMGTNVVSGSATAVVVATGARTFFGSLAQRVTAQRPTVTSFQQGVNRVSWVLIRFMLVMTPIVLLINGFTKHDWLEASLFALSVAVGLTPEMLPMIVTATLAKGAVVLSRKKVIVKRLDAIQNFGAMDVLCTDKTGTLTQDRICLERHTDVWGHASEDVLEYAYLNSFYQTGLKNLLDVAVLDHGELHRRLDVVNRYRKIDEIPFDFERRRMSVVVSENGEHHELICKGAVEEMMAVCDRVQHGANVEPLTPDVLSRLRRVTADLNAEGLRVVAVATRHLPPVRESYSVADESGLVLVGYIAFLDPPKESTAPALKALAASGVDVKVLTGDNDLVTVKVCREVGLAVTGCVLGDAIESMSDAELARTVEHANVFAKLTPTHKERIVHMLRANGHVVGFMGDGINDAPALRAADIGISVDTAVDIAKEAADLILLEKSLMVLEQGVIEGRRTFANMLKYIKMTASSNFGNVFSVLIASAFLPFLPMLPLQLLTQNLLYDLSQTTIPFDNVDPEQLMRPQQWNPADLSRFMIFFGPISSIFDVLTFVAMWHLFGANSAEHQTLFQSGWFVEGLLSQTLIVHLIRTRRIPFVQSRAAWPLLLMTGAVMLIGVMLPLSPFAETFRMQALPLAYFPMLAAILLAYAVLTQMMKGMFARRFGWQ
ncbi:magnesium-translocating P-type ATPase [Pandoraea pulmonicola]|uniref:Magnesium-transporting ATPase, P-type 1 n=1 Tax=Pandoraea pulmonicola TaxID=93221 RepID=A0AAJ4ZAK8_PANPU|nr:magnesium-translocating P-type ATPase [Pandoraea pulmonicola]AJC23358.1 magnesium-translocating P-type ATPase [Pandoraea pulmonicola]SUA89822.1 Magnesium-transporting ATPase, P-type 1 [Pandoraea pulmonicola]